MQPRPATGGRQQPQPHHPASAARHANGHISYAAAAPPPPAAPAAGHRNGPAAALPPPHPNPRSAPYRVASSSPSPMHPDIKRALSSRPSPSPSAQQLQQSASASSSSSSLPKLRLVVLFFVCLGLLMLVPLAHLVLSSSLLSSAFCQPSVISAQAASSMRSLLLSDQAAAARSLSPLSSSSVYYAFTFPRPTPYVFITSHPDPSASLSQQYSQWLYGPYLALTLNVSYAYTPLLKLSSRWNGFLGAGHGETPETELQAEFGRTRYFQRSFDDPAAAEDDAGGAGGAGGSGSGVVEDWIRSRRKKVDHLNHQIAVYAKRAQHVHDLPPLELDEPKGSHIDGYNTRHLDPAQPVNTVTVFRLYRIGLPSLLQACLPALHLLMRQKYCAARVRQPLPVDLYADARRAGQMIVAAHILCGEQCWNPDKTAAISVFITALRSIAAIAANSSLPSPSFHVFSSLPVNDSWSPQRYFSPLTAAFPRLQLHLDLHSHLVFHHLVMSDVLLPPPLGSSSTSWLVQLLHAGIVVGSPVPVHACQGDVDGWRKETGSFDSRSFVREWLRMQSRRQRFDSLQDCHQMQQLPPR